MAPTVHFSRQQAGAQITIHDYAWGAPGNATTLTYGFRNSAPPYNYTDSDVQNTFTQLTAAQKGFATSALGLWSDVAGITFTPVNPTGFTDNAVMLFGNYNSATDNAQALGNYPITDDTAFSSRQGDVWINAFQPNAFNLAFGSYAFMAFLHEIGHSIGLEHPGPYNGAGATYENDAVYIEDTRQYSVMSYFAASNTGADHTDGSTIIYASTPLIDDIAAVQRLYGANMATRTGNTVYGFNNTAGAAYAIGSATEQKIFCIWDAGGNDTLDLSGYSTNQYISLLPGSFSDAGALTRNISIAEGVMIETAKGGSGDDDMFGNTGENVLKGGGGADVLSGDDGPDTLAGEGGDDTLFGGIDNDWLDGGENTDYLKGGGGADLLDGGSGNDEANYRDSFGAVTVNLTAGTGAGGYAQGDTLFNIENLGGSFYGDSLTGDGNRNRLQGWGSIDNLNGLANNDILDGGAGGDRLDGGPDSDTAAYETATVGVTANLAAPANNTGDAAGDTYISIENLRGSSQVDNLTGDSNANTLDGAGGVDTLTGGGGDDWYFLDVAGDSVVETASQGNDRVFAHVTYTLPAAADIEKLTTDDNLALNAINLTGNDIPNIIFGNAGTNTLDGRGGADTMLGLGGDDTYRVDNGADTVFEAANEGLNDRIFTSVNYVLGAGVQVETLLADPAASTVAINLTGNELANALDGNDGPNTLDGRGGVDTLLGFRGDDYFYADDALDRAIEFSGQGYDRVLTSVDYTLSPFQELEKLTTDNNSGMAPITLIGNSIDNAIFGNAGSNALKGLLGNDTLVGMGGIDAFVFNTALDAATNVDTIADFATDDDIILAGWIFTAITPGTLAPGAFALGPATTAAHRIIYNSATGAVSYDPDGVGGSAAVQFAIISGAPAVTNADFIIV